MCTCGVLRESFGCRSARSSPCSRRMRSRSRRRARRRVCAPPWRTRATIRPSARRRALVRGEPSRAQGRCRISTIRNRASFRASAIRPAPVRAAPGFVSTNIRRSIGPNRRSARRPGVPAPTGIGLAPPLSLTAPGTSPTATLLRSTAAGTSVRSTGTTGSAEAATPKPVAVTAPCGRAAAQSAAAHSGRHGDRRHRRNREQHAPDDRLDDAAAPAHRGGGRCIRAARPAPRRVSGFAVARSDRRLRHQSGARARRTRPRRSSRSRPS